MLSWWLRASIRRQGGTAVSVGIDLASHLHGARLPSGFSTSSVTPALLHTLSSAVQHGLAAAYAESIQTVFIIAAPIGFIAFLASWLIPRLELRRGVRTPQVGSTESGADVPAPQPLAGPPEPLVPDTTHRSS